MLWHFFFFFFFDTSLISLFNTYTKEKISDSEIKLHIINSNCLFFYLFLSELQLVVYYLVLHSKSDSKAPFSRATTPKCQGGHYSLPWIGPLYPCSVPYNAVLSKKVSSTFFFFFFFFFFWVFGTSQWNTVFSTKLELKSLCPFLNTIFFFFSFDSKLIFVFYGTK